MYTASLVCGGGRLRGLAKKKIVHKLLLRSTPRKARLRDLEKNEEKKRRAYAASHAGVLLSSNLCTIFFFLYAASLLCAGANLRGLACRRAARGARFTCFTSTTVQILTPEALLEVLNLLALLVPKYKY